MAELPITLVKTISAQERDRRRIYSALMFANLKATDEQVEELRQWLSPLEPEDDHLREAVLACVQVDWTKATESIGTTLRKIADDFETDRAADETYVHNWYGDWMGALTRGTEQHPAWWTYPCACNQCMAETPGDVAGKRTSDAAEGQDAPVGDFRDTKPF